MSKWKAERRPGKVVATEPVEQRLEDEWWLTDGVESFRMVAKFHAEMLASYLNKRPS